MYFYLPLSDLPLMHVIFLRFDSSSSSLSFRMVIRNEIDDSCELD